MIKPSISLSLSEYNENLTLIFEFAQNLQNI